MKWMRDNSVCLINSSHDGVYVGVGDEGDGDVVRLG